MLPAALVLLGLVCLVAVNKSAHLRAWAIYPCASGCAQPRDGGGDPDAEPDRDGENRGKGKHKDRWDEGDD